MRRVSSGVSGAMPEILTGTSLPDTSTTGWLPGDMIKSLTLTDAFSMASNKAGVGTGFGSAVTGAGAGLAAVSTRWSFLRKREVSLMADESRQPLGDWSTSAASPGRTASVEDRASCWGDEVCGTGCYRRFLGGLFCL